MLELILYTFGLLWTAFFIAYESRQIHLIKGTYMYNRKPILVMHGIALGAQVIFYFVFTCALINMI